MRLSKSFSLQEFASHDGAEFGPGVVANLHRLCIEVLQPLRDRWNGPLVIISGYRSPEWNTKVGGAGKSTHMTGEGADVRPLNPEDLPAFFSTIEEMRVEGALNALGGLGKYGGPGWAHLDTRKADDGHLRRWTGKGFGAEQ